jgi:anti-sigma B factor antagonist
MAESAGLRSNPEIAFTERRHFGVTTSDERLGRDDRALAIDTYRDGDEALVLQLFGEFDLASVPSFEAEMTLAERAGTPLVIDLSGLEFIDSTGISQLLAAHERAARDGRELVFLKGPPSLERILRITGMDEILAFAD